MMLRAHDLIAPLKHFVDRMLEEHGEYMFMGFGWLCLIAIAWVLAGGLRRNRRSIDCCQEEDSDDPGISVGLIIYPPTPPVLPPPPPIDCGPSSEYPPNQD